MPYTPPSSRSPASSAASSPDTSRRPSFNAASKPVNASLHFSPAPPSALPRSSSYLTRHRRTPSAVSNSSVSTISGQPTPQPTSDNLHGMVPVVSGHSYDENSSVRQSPPPITGERRGMPTGAVISPPDSPPTSDDEGHVETRGRRLESMSELKQLHDAVSQLPQQRRASSPNNEPADLGVLVVQPIPPVVSSISNISSTETNMRHSFSTTSLDHLRIGGGRSSSIGSNGRRISHMRSATEPSVSVSPSAGSSVANSDEENDLEILAKPPMVRKKSGELVRPALRLGAGRRPSSMPGTPTFSKVVHFDSHLEHVRHFLQVDRPLAVSAGSSPVEVYESESEYPFNSSIPGMKQQQQQQQQKRGGPPFEWEIVLTKFPVETAERKALPVRLERVWLSPDQKFLHGSVSCLNLAFSKLVVCRFTLDYWKTTSEIAAEYSAEIVPRVTPQGNDRFNFTIKLSDLANLESKTMYFCIRYNVDGKEFWDNNNGSNFQLDFKKKMLAINGKSGLQNGALPRSHHRRANATSTQRPVSMPVSLDDFGSSANGHGSKMFDQSVHEYLGESDRPALRLKSSQNGGPSLASDNLTARLVSPSGQAFANRYDFGASLSAAMQAAKDAMATNKRDGGLYMKPSRKVAVVPAPSADAAVKVGAASANTNERVIAVNTTQEPTTVALPVAALDRDSRTILTESALYGPGGIASKSYDEIVSKYCFYVPKPSLPTKDGSSAQNGQNDTKATSSPASTITSDGSPVHTARTHQEPSRPRWHADVPSRDSSSLSIQSVGSSTSSASPPTSGFVQTSPVTNQGHVPGQPRRGTMFATGPLISAGDKAGSGDSDSASTSSSNTASPASPASPAALAGAFPPFAGTPPPPDYSFVKDRFPFANADGHAATAIKG
ncbi:carbohydrate-binding protein module family 21 [Sporothrix schenckii 1099-18]|uniref:Carbohydrate-binding protein module family 21 n=1 Tax=Sporothrix schenckii 1099-18 TaxID=1397361 RepID=A0A0F2LVJ2_SPOSC|nr:carbohydrate-binding protein module family 21 [Sporothrix schenckii 1099-18]KJR81463.1 carbohydrate-binding protein module family 21 [Sporothrix schenckii 1099-18]